MEHTFEQPSSDQQPPTPRQEATTSQLMTRIDDLEKQLKETKQTFGKAILTLVERVKTLEVALKRKTKRSFTPSKTVNASGEEQVEDIRKSLKEFAGTGLDFEEVKSAFEEVNTGGIKVSSGIEEINTGSLDVNTGIDPVTTDSIRVSVPSPDREDWDTIRAKLEANAELKESVLGKDLTVEDYAKRMVELVNQRRKHFAEERARAKRNKPMTQTQLRNYMSNFLKNQGTWKLTQLKKLNFEEVKAEFEKLVKQLDTYVPMNFEATKESLKRFGEELQTKTTKKLKFDDEGTHHSGEDEANEKDNSTSGTKIPINPVHVATKSPSIANYKIIKQGRKELYRIVMRKHGMNEPEDEFEKVDKKLQGGKPDEDCYKLLKMMEKQAGIRK
ncbi:hypothetical protein Tco_0973113 [Tanacetum coccineum]